MKKLLLLALFIGMFLLGGLMSASHAYAQTEELIPIEGEWVEDPEVTFTGKNAARSKELLDWTLTDYRWTFTQENKTNPIQEFWVVIRNIIYAVFILFVIATAFILIATRGKSLSAMRFIPRFFAIVILVTFSFSLISLLYQTTDIVQGFFLTSPRVANASCPPDCISQEDLFFIDWDYETFIGYRQVGEKYAESAFINLLLVKLTAFTYYVMVGTLFIRKIILWFFIILSPVFPLLLLYYPVRNTGKIWIGEFFRWLLYAPLFAIFLAGLVRLWRSDNNIPLNFDLPTGAVSQEIYPTATSILIGGPQMVLSLKNSANNVETFALYLVALLMLWMVILLPWVLLQIFLEYAMSYNYAESPMFKGLMGWANRAKKPPAVPPSTPPPPRKPGPDLPPMKKPIIPPPPPAGAGLARTIPTETTRVYKTPTTLIKPMPSYVQTLRMTSMSVPTLRDVARFETAMVSNKASEIHEISRVKETLEKLGNPTSTMSSTDMTRMSEIREKLVKESMAGNIMASTILNASQTMKVVNMTTNQVTNNIKETFSKISRPEAITNAVEKQKYNTINQSLTKASQEGNQFATETLSQISTIAKAETPEQQKQEISKLKNKLVEEKQKGNELAKQLVSFVDQETKPSALPTQNQIQTVSLEDYEAVRKMWTKNYQTMDVPQSVTKGQLSRSQWIQDDVNEISKTINMLSSSDQEVVDQGLQEVSTILPFLMMGGFTLPEIVGYLKAKQQAATDSLEQVKSKDEEEASLIDTKRATTASAVMHQSMTIPEPGEGSTPTTNTTSTTSYSSSSDDEGDDSSMLSNISSQVSQQVSKTTQHFVSILPTFMNVIKLTPNSTPNLKDVVNYETSMVHGGQTVHDEVTQTQEMLSQLADPTIIVNPEKRQEIETMRKQLETESKAGNKIATSILQAATTIASVKQVSTEISSQTKTVVSQIMNPEKVTDTVKQSQFKEVNTELMKQKESGNEFASSVVKLSDLIITSAPNSYNEQMAVAALKVKVTDEAQKNNPLAQKLGTMMAFSVPQAKQVVLPKQNTVQTVSLDDYESVKKMWEENYKTMEVPQNIMKGTISRLDWVSDDIAEITRIINLLSSSDPEVVNEGLAAVSQILPFLLIGGFSLSEIIAYLKAKLEAAKAALSELKAVQNEEDQKLEVNEAPMQTVASQSMAQASPEETTPPLPPLPRAESDSETFFPTSDEPAPLKELGDEDEPRQLGDEPKPLKDLEELDNEK